MEKTLLTITDFKITNCGYFKKLARKSPKLFGNSNSALASLLNWSNNKNLLETKTFEGQDNLSTYLMNMVTNDNEYLVCLWNETHNLEGKVLSVPLDVPVGSADIATAKLTDGHTPGYPTYFWFKPDLETFSTIQFPKAITGRDNLRIYLESYLEKFNEDHVVSTKNTDIDAEFHKEITGYKNNKTGDNTTNKEEVICKFESFLVKNEMVRAEIEAVSTDIYGIIRKEEISASMGNNDSILGKIIKSSGIKTTDHSTEMKYRVKYEVNFKPTESELAQILNNWDVEDGDKWSNIGFKVSGKTSPIWIDSTISRNQYEIEVKQDGFTVNLMHLLHQLQNLNND